MWFRKESAWAFLLAFINLIVIWNIFDTNFLMGVDEFSLQYDGFFAEKSSLYTWNDWINLGHNNLSTNNIAYLALFNFFNFIFSSSVVERILYWILFFFCCYSMFILLARYYKINYFVAATFSLFFEYNLHHVIMPLAVNPKLVYIALPMVIIILKKYILDRKLLKLSIVMPLGLLVIAQVAANPPAVSIIFILILAYLIYQIILKNIKFKEALLFFFGASFFFVLFNFWWLSTLIPAMLESSGNIVTGLNAAILRASQYLNVFNVMRYLGYGPWWLGEGVGHKYVQFSQVFDGSYFLIAYSFLPPLFIIGALALFGLSKQKNYWKEKDLIFWVLIFIFGVFLAKGINAPGGWFFGFLWQNIPGFWIFRDPWAKFIPLVVLSSVITGAIVCDYIIQRFKIFRVAILGIMLITVYFYAVFPDIYYNDNFLTMRSLHVDVPQYWENYADKYEKKKLVMRNLTFPKTPNGSHFFSSGFSGPLPFISLVSRQPFIIYPNFSNTGNVNDRIIDDFYGSEYKNSKLWSYLNVGYATQQNDYNWLVGYKDTFPPSEMEKILNSIEFLEKKDSFGNFDFNYIRGIDFGRDKTGEERRLIADELRGRSALDIYKLKPNYFLPLVYIPKEITFSSREVESIARISNEQKLGVSSAVFFLNQNNGEIDEENIKKTKILNNYQKSDDTTVEFKKINPTKYRIIVHNASSKFPLVFSESFHEKWKIYLVNEFSKDNKPASFLSEYKILDGNDDDQATKEELSGYIQNGWISTLGEGKEKQTEYYKQKDSKRKLDYVEKYKISFVSKNFQGTIQNDNLPDGYFWETWFKNPISEEDNHLMVNGYANSWIIDVEKMCKDNPNFCVNNLSCETGQGKSCLSQDKGESYDFELVVEFWPQRLFYIGVVVSSVALLLCGGYLAYDWRKRMNNKFFINKKGEEYKNGKKII